MPYLVRPDGCRLHHELHGPQDSSPLILLEGLGGDILVASQNPQPPHAGRRQWEAIQAWSAWDRLGDIRCPTLVLHGTEDRLVAPRNAQMLAERIPGATLFLLEGAGHVYHSEQAEPADRVVLDFLRSVEGGR